MNFSVVPEIIKEEKHYVADLCDISYGGLCFSTNQRLYQGVRTDIFIDGIQLFAGAEIVRVDEQETGSGHTVGVEYYYNTKRLEYYHPLSLWIDGIPDDFEDKETLDMKERRKFIRKKVRKSITIRESHPKINLDNFNLLHNGLNCKINQYLPVFHEIEINLNNKNKKPTPSFSGVVVKCDKVSDHEYDLEVFFQDIERDKFNKYLLH